MEAEEGEGGNDVDYTGCEVAEMLGGGAQVEDLCTPGPVPSVYLVFLPFCSFHVIVFQ